MYIYNWNYIISYNFYYLRIWVIHSYMVFIKNYKGDEWTCHGDFLGPSEQMTMIDPWHRVHQFSHPHEFKWFSHTATTQHIYINIGVLVFKFTSIFFYGWCMVDHSGPSLEDEHHPWMALWHRLLIWTLSGRDDIIHMEPKLEVPTIYTYMCLYTHTHTHTYMYIHICIYIYYIHM